MHQQKPQGTPQVYKRGVPSAHGRKGANQFNNKSPRAPLRCTSEGCPAHMDGRAKSIQQQKLQGTPQVYKRGVPSAHGRKGEIDSTTKAAGHPSGVQARGAQRTWTEGRKRFNNKSCRAPLRCTSEGCPAHMDGRERTSS